MMSKKDMLTLGVLAVGGVAVASSFAGGVGGLTPQTPRAGGILGSQQRYASVYQLPAQASVAFPATPKFDIGSFLTSETPETPISRGTAGVSSEGKKEVIYGGYKPSGQSYIFGGKAFEAQAAKEVVTQGYSPTLGAAFGLRKAPGGASKKSVSSAPKTAVSKAVSHAKRLRAGRGD